MKKWSDAELDTLRKCEREAKTYGEAVALLVGRNRNQVIAKCHYEKIYLADGRKKTVKAPEPLPAHMYESVPPVKAPKPKEQRCMWYMCAKLCSGIYCEEHMKQSGLARRKALIAGM
jgi:hypothetical protein